MLLRDTQEGVTTDSQAIVSETVNDLVFQFKAGEFFQNNSFLLPEMVSHVVSEAEGEGLECLVDAYCGGGLFALSAAQSFARVMGVEISRDGIPHRFFEIMIQFKTVPMLGSKDSYTMAREPSTTFSARELIDLSPKFTIGFLKTVQKKLK